MNNVDDDKYFSDVTKITNDLIEKCFPELKQHYNDQQDNVENIHKKLINIVDHLDKLVKEN